MTSLLTVGETAKRLNISRRKLRYLVKSGDGPPALRLGEKTTRFDPAAVDAFIHRAAQPTQNKN